MTQPPGYPFERMRVRFAVEGGTRVEWDIDPHLIDPYPHTFQLQGSSAAVPTADDWIAVGTAVEDARYLIDPDRRVCGKGMDWSYRVLLTTLTDSYISPVAPPLTTQDFRDWRLSRDMVRKESLRHRLYTSLKGSLYQRRRYGLPCTACLEPLTGTVTDDHCPQCFGTEITGGYYPPSLFYVELGLESSREHVDPASVGTTKPIVIKVRALGDPLARTYDVFADLASGRRYHVQTVVRAAEYRGYPIVTELELRQADFGDVIYNLGVPQP